MTQDDRAMAVREVTPGEIAAYDADQAAKSLAHVLGSGDLAKLTNEQRVAHYLGLCRSLGLNPLSRPFDWIYFKDSADAPEKLALYANQSCAAQLRRQHHMRVEVTRREIVGELFVCEVRGTTPDGREETATKYVPLSGKYGPFKGQMLANAMMKAETGAKRRLTFSMIGMASPPDAEDAAGWRPATVDGRGQIIEHPTEEQRALAADPKLARVIGEPVYEDYQGPLSGDDLPDQRARPEELERPRSEGPRPTFKAYVDKCRARFFAIVAGTTLDDDEARHELVSAWMAEHFPPEQHTSSSTTMFSRMTQRQADDFLAHVEGLVNVEKGAAVAPPAHTPMTRDDLPADVAAAAMLTGAPPAELPRPEEGKTYSRVQWEAMYAAWARRRQFLDSARVPEDVATLKGAALVQATRQVIAEVDELESYLAQPDEANESELVEAF